ncbi:hypothetical protein DPX16_17479 [Anabarilius grahami]|uniref:Uncharacterized protein n=1 Tax=Anabarilius grahami TaxID=495550 RepID=A0A3N0XZE5_ANAGA|nr:hypothetical protein DPX16_17479 [Anabarilius grahami]
MGLSDVNGGRKSLYGHTRRPERESKSTPIKARSASRKSSAALHRIGAYGFINKAQFHAGFTDSLKLKDGAVTAVLIPDMSRNSRCASRFYVRTPARYWPAPAQTSKRCNDVAAYVWFRNPSDVVKNILFPDYIMYRLKPFEAALKL